MALLNRNRTAIHETRKHHGHQTMQINNIVLERTCIYVYMYCLLAFYISCKYRRRSMQSHTHTQGNSVWGLWESKKSSQNEAVREQITYSAWALARGVPDYRHIHAPKPLHNREIVWGLWKRRSASKAQVVHEKTEWNDRLMLLSTDQCYF